MTIGVLKPADVNSNQVMGIHQTRKLEPRENKRRPISSKVVRNASEAGFDRRIIDAALDGDR